MTALIKQLSDLAVANQGVIHNDVVKFLNAIVDGVPKLVHELIPLLTLLGSIASVLNAVAQALGGWDNIIAIMVAARIGQFVYALAKLSKAVGDLNIAMLANPAAWMAAGFAAVSIVLFEVWKHWDWVSEHIGAGIDWLRKKLEPLLKLFGITQKSAGSLGINVGNGLGSGLPVVNSANLGKIKFGPSVPTIGTPGGATAAASAAVNGSIHVGIEVDDKRVRVKRLRQTGAAHASVSHGPLLMGAAQ
jgi:hypothetical protein